MTSILERRGRLAGVRPAPARADARACRSPSRRCCICSPTAAISSRSDGRWARRTLDELEVPAAIQRFDPRAAGAALPGRAGGSPQAAAVAGVAAPAELLRQRRRPFSRREQQAGCPRRCRSACCARRRAAGWRFRHALAQRARLRGDRDPGAAAPASPGGARSSSERGRAAPARADRPPPPAGRTCPRSGSATPRPPPISRSRSATTRPRADLLAEALGCPEASPAARARMAVKLGQAAARQPRPRRRRWRSSAACSTRTSLPAGVRGEVRLYVGLLLDNQAGQASAGLAEIARAVPSFAADRDWRRGRCPCSPSRCRPTGHLAEHLDWMKPRARGGRSGSRPGAADGGARQSRDAC